MATKDCDKIIEQLPLFIDDMLESSQAEAVSEHIDKCPDCKKEYNYLKAIMKKTGELPEKELPTDFHEELMQKIRKEKKSRHIVLRRVSAYAAAAAVVAMSFLALGEFKNDENTGIKEKYITSEVSDEPISEEVLKEKLVSIENKTPKKAQKPKEEIINEEQIPASISLEEVEEDKETFVTVTVTPTDDIRDVILEILSPYEKDDTGYIVEDIDSLIKTLKEKDIKITVSTPESATQNYVIIK